MTEKTRALTRFNEERVKANRKRYLKRYSFNGLSQPGKEPSAKLVGKTSHTPANCSCAMCGNPRRIHGDITIQEKRFLDVANEHKVKDHFDLDLEGSYERPV